MDRLGQIFDYALIVLVCFLGQFLLEIVLTESVPILDRFEKAASRSGVLGILKLIFVGPLYLVFVIPIILALTVEYPEVPRLFVVASVLAVISITLLAVRFLSSRLKRHNLSTTMKGAGEDHSDSASGFGEGNQALIGKVGTVVAMLRPAGIARIGNSKVDVITAGSFVEYGAEVRVVAVEGNRVVVERAGQGEEPDFRPSL